MVGSGVLSIAGNAPRFKTLVPNNALVIREYLRIPAWSQACSCTPQCSPDRARSSGSRQALARLHVHHVHPDR